MFLVFIFLIAQTPEKICVAAASERSSPGQLALDCSKGHALCASPSQYLVIFISGNGRNEFPEM
jgi:hypothetical protein